MKLKSRLLGIAAAAALSLSFVLPAVTDASQSTALVSVVLTDNGVFAATIDAATLTGVTVNAGLGGTATGTICVKYVDTLTMRGQFHTQLQSSDFVSQHIVVPAGRTNAGQPYKIGASNYEVTRNFDVFQGRWSSWARANLGYDVGDIGSSSAGNDDDYSSGPYVTADRVPAVGCGVDTGTTGIDNHPWTAGASTSKLDGNQIIGFGFEGPGTAGPFPPTYGSLHLLYTKLTVPAGQPADTYAATLTLTVTFTPNSL